MTNIKTYEEFAKLSEQEQKEKFEEILRDNGYYFRWWQEGEHQLKESLDIRDEQLKAKDERIESLTKLIKEMTDEHFRVASLHTQTIKKLVLCPNMEELNMVKSIMLKEEINNNYRALFSGDIYDKVNEVLKAADNGEEGTDTSAD